MPVKNRNEPERTGAYLIDPSAVPPPDSGILKFLLVIPCLRERARLPDFLPLLLQVLRPHSSQVEVLTVDDGSGPAEQAWLKKYCEDQQSLFPFLLPALLLPANQGKGGAVYAGWETAGPEVTHLALVDADGAVPPEEVQRLIELVLADSTAPAGACFAVRTGADGTRVDRTVGRKIAGQVFRVIVRMLFRFPLADTQCGFKIVPAQAWRDCAVDLREKRFCFDVDLTWHLLHLGVPLRQVPIHWSERPGSRLRAGSLWAMVSSLWSLRQRLGQWMPRSRGDSASG